MGDFVVVGEGKGGTRWEGGGEMKQPIIVSPIQINHASRIAYLGGRLGVGVALHRHQQDVHVVVLFNFVVCECVRVWGGSERVSKTERRHTPTRIYEINCTPHNSPYLREEGESKHTHVYLLR